MVKSGHTRPSGTSYDRENICHWSQSVKKVSFRTLEDCDTHLKFGGGSDNGELIFVSEVSSNIKYTREFALETGDIILKIQEQNVSGFTLLDAVNLLLYCCKNHSIVVIECVAYGELLILIQLDVRRTHTSGMNVK